VRRGQIQLGGDAQEEMNPMNSWYLVHTPAWEASRNMAFDEAMLGVVSELQTPILRFYSWTQSAATFGYFQKFLDVEKLTSLRPLVRRPTAGGIVPHDADWTYGLAFPTHNEWYALKAVESYRRVHEWLCLAFDHLGVATEVAPCCLKSAPGQCFLGHEQYDLLWKGRKVAGAAQRRTRQGLLIQGSVQPPPLRLLRSDWESAMCRAGQGASVRWVNLDPGLELLRTVDALAATKYALDSYNRKR
jgi:hypothetical protein